MHPFKFMNHGANEKLEKQIFFWTEYKIHLILTPTEAFEHTSMIEDKSSKTDASY